MKHSEAEKVGVLFVCMGNICRSPTADAVFNHHVKSARLEHLFHIDSAGTHAYHIGEPPDRRSQQAALRRGYNMQSLRARRVVPEDFHASNIFWPWIVITWRNCSKTARHDIPAGWECSCNTVTNGIFVRKYLIHTTAAATDSKEYWIW